MLAKKSATRKVSELESASEFDSVRVLLVTGSYMQKTQYDIAGGIPTGRMNDIAMKFDGSTALEGQNMLVDQELKPKILSRLDSIVKDALKSTSPLAGIFLSGRSTEFVMHR